MHAVTVPAAMPRSNQTVTVGADRAPVTCDRVDDEEPSPSRIVRGGRPANGVALLVIWSRGQLSRPDSGDTPIHAVVRQLAGG